MTYAYLLIITLVSIPICSAFEYKGLINCDNRTLSTTSYANDSFYTFNIEMDSAYLKLDSCGSQNIAQYEIGSSFNGNIATYKINSDPQNCSESELFYGPLLSGYYYLWFNKQPTASFGSFELTISCTTPNETIPYETIECGETISGSTIAPNDVIQYFQFETHQNLSTIIISTCWFSDYDTDIFLYDKDYNILAYNDYNPNYISYCSDYQSRYASGPLNAGEYIIGITGYHGARGNYDLVLSCVDYIPSDSCMFISDHIKVVHF